MMKRARPSETGAAAQPNSGSIEAIKKEMLKLEHPEVQIKILQDVITEVVDAEYPLPGFQRVAVHLQDHLAADHHGGQQGTDHEGIGERFGMHQLVNAFVD